MKKETQKTLLGSVESVKVEAQDFYMSSKEAAAYLRLDYCNFRKQRNKGYFGRDRYPAPNYCFIGEGEQDTCRVRNIPYSAAFGSYSNQNQDIQLLLSCLRSSFQGSPELTATVFSAFLSS